MPPVLDILVVVLSFWRVVDKRVRWCSTVWKAQLPVVLQLDIRAMMKQGNRRLNILIAAGSLFVHFYVIYVTMEQVVVSL